MNDAERASSYALGSETTVEADRLWVWYLGASNGRAMNLTYCFYSCWVLGTSGAELVGGRVLV